MDDVMRELAPLIGGGGVLALLSVGLLYATKEAIARAVSQAGAHELERLRGALATELEEQRQAFAMDLERERQVAARSLEEFKANLTLDAEVRRQVAAKKVEALLRIADMTKTILGDALYDVEVPKRLATIDAYWLATREAEAVAGPDVLEHMWAFGRFLQENLGTLDKVRRGEGGSPTDLSATAETARRALLAEIRRELQVELSTR